MIKPVRPMVRLIALAALLLSQASCAVEPVKHLVPMQDGTKLVTDVYTPSGDGKWPVLLARSTYGRGKGEADKFVRQGYAVVIQDVRGMGESEGEKYVFHPDGWREGLKDGADTVAWIKAQPWSNGVVGTFGGSALGITQQLCAPAMGGLSGQYIEVAASNMYRADLLSRGRVGEEPDGGLADGDWPATPDQGVPGTSALR